MRVRRGKSAPVEVRIALDALHITGHSTTSPTSSVPMIRKKRLPLGHLALYGWLPSPLKVWAYRTFRRYRIGRGVKLAFGAVVVGEDVELADHVEIGLLAMVMGRTIRIGRHSSVGTMSYVACERIQIGEDARIREQVFVGGPQLPESSFTLGSRTIILQLTSINPTKPVTIGDDTGIGGHCLIFTHGAWLNALDGYPVTYEPVTLGNSVWLPWRVFIMPGTTIGDGSVIGANSLVQGNIPPMSLAVGSPAKVIRSAPDFPRVPSEEKKAGIVADMVSEFERYVTYEHYVVEVHDGVRSYRPSKGGGGWRLIWRRTPDALRAVRGDTVLSEVALSDSEKAELRSHGVHWLDLSGRSRSAEGSPLTEELATFIARYGIRLPRDG
ncbi:MAG TPA: acyltransferase [Gemmatimonadaceae bacterium]|nr:acyltransferase [Gemmatimonadaceae bacterium]